MSAPFHWTAAPVSPRDVADVDCSTGDRRLDTQGRVWNSEAAASTRGSSSRTLDRLEGGGGYRAPGQICSCAAIWTHTVAYVPEKLEGVFFFFFLVNLRLLLHCSVFQSQQNGCVSILSQVVWRLFQCVNPPGLF